MAVETVGGLQSETLVSTNFPRCKTSKFIKLILKHATKAGQHQQIIKAKGSLDFKWVGDYSLRKIYGKKAIRCVTRSLRNRCMGQKAR